MKKPSAATTPEAYLDTLEEPRRGEVETLHKLIRKTVPKFAPFMLGGIIGYGKYHYKYASGREGDWFHIGLTSGKTGISVYVVAVDENGYLAEQAKAKLGKAIVGKSCIRFKKLADIDLAELTRLIKRAGELPGMGEEDAAPATPAKKTAKKK